MPSQLYSSLILPGKFLINCSNNNEIYKLWLKQFNREEDQHNYLTDPSETENTVTVESQNYTEFTAWLEKYKASGTLIEKHQVPFAAIGSEPENDETPGTLR